MFDSFAFSATQWGWPAGLLFIVCSLLAAWSYWSSRGPASVRLAAGFLKALAFGLLAVCLLEPVQRKERPLPGANTLAVLMDNSCSMELRPSGSSTTRADELRAKIQQDAPWMLRVAQDFTLKQYLFDERVQPVEELSKADFQGRFSMLGNALKTLETRFSKQPMAGLILFSDGLATDLPQLDNDQLKQFPIYPIITSGKPSFKDIAIGETSVSLSSFELSPVSVEAVIDCHGLSGQEIAVRIFDKAGKTLEKQSFKAESNDFMKRLRFQFRLTDVGWQTVNIRAMLSSEDTDQLDASGTLEVTQINNHRILGVDRGGGPYRILYVAGRPNWEFKFLRRALDEDLEIKLQALIRVAKKEPRFSFGDKSLGNVNPLVAGFADNTDTAEQHDEPVLIRLGVDDDEQLKAGFPGSAEDLFGYHAIILDDVESSFFSSEQMLLMRQFVSERGGGFMMLGGQESLLGGNYEGTPIADLLPVYLRGQEFTELKDSPAQYKLTREGELQPWLRLRPTKPEELQRFSQMPNFLTWNSVADVKPGASTLATLQVEDRTLPGLVSQRFGKGQTAAIMIGDFWRWSLRRSATDKDDLAQTWRQIARWLTSDVPKRVEFEVTPPVSPSDPHRLMVELKDEEFKPLDNASVQIAVVEPSGKELTISLQADPTRLGRYTSEYWSRLDGGYACTVQAMSPDGVELEPLKSGWTAQPSAAEFSRVMPDLQLLQQLAERSGGEVIQLEDLDSFVSTLPTRKVPITETRVEPWWHRPWLVLLAISCLCGEWALRRWRGLP